MYTKINAATLIGLECERTTVEVDISGTWPGFQIIGLTDVAIQEAKERIKTAWKNSGYIFPNNARIVINLAPADSKKGGSSYDVPMAIGMYLSLNKIDSTPLETNVYIGELALDGSVRHVNGVLPLTIFAKEQGYKEIFVPETNAQEANIIPEITVYPIKTFKQLVEHITGINHILPKEKTAYTRKKPTYHLDMADIKGQESAKRALEIVASGGHNILLSGPPGSGKTLLSRTLPSILPPMSTQECIEVTKIYSASGLLPPNTDLITTRPFRSPHHTSSTASIIGGGRTPKPGEISLAHRGIFSADEFPEFPKQIIESLRQPLEDKIITVSRVQGTATFPANIMLVASMNPCPCGFASDPSKQCTCSPQHVERYNKKLSGPILDRIDLYVEVPKIPFEKLNETITTETSKTMRNKVSAARQKQQKRFTNSTTVCNSEMTNKENTAHCQLDDGTKQLLKQAVSQLNISPRSYFRIIKVGRTIADLADSEHIHQEHIAEALQYRKKE